MTGMLVLLIFMKIKYVVLAIFLAQFVFTVVAKGASQIEDTNGFISKMSSKDKKVKLGQFFTKESLWLKPQIIKFIKDSKATIAYDPFAGGGDLLKVSHLYGIGKTKGLDIDSSLSWEVNDSLVSIPSVKDAIIITNPPYLSNYSASRKKIYGSVAKYFDDSRYDDLYLIALTRMLEAQKYVVAIIPETFLNSSFVAKNKLASVTVLEENPFEDTDTPVCVACFDSEIKSFEKIDVFKNDKFIGKLSFFESLRLRPKNDVTIRFNVLNGWLGLRAVDTTNPAKMIQFDFKENFDYDWNKGIKVSSRLLSTIDIDVPMEKRQAFIDECNHILTDIRQQSADIVMSPFKGNMKNGVRRRRLDYMTARSIMEKAYKTVIGFNYEQDDLFEEIQK